MSTSESSGESKGAAGPTFVKIFAPLFWGFCVTLILSGVSVLQGYLYFTRYSDKTLIRGLATLMLVLDFVSTGLICQSVYYYTLPHFGSLAPLTSVTRELSAECLISVVIAFISQMYFVYQLKVVQSPFKVVSIFTALIIVLGMISLGTGICCVATMFIHPKNVFSHRIRAFTILAGMHNAFGAGTDVVATVAMCTFLKLADTGMKRTSLLVRNIMHLVINRGVLVASAQVLLLVMFFTAPDQLYWLAVHINTTKLYANTFFAMLNSRKPAQEDYADHTTHISMGGSSSIRFTGAPFDTTFPTQISAKKFHEHQVGSIMVTQTSTSTFASV